MPRYDYRCLACGETFELRHGFHEAAGNCPHCGAAQLQKVISSVPRQAKGIEAEVGKNASKEQLQSKWAEETPKLRKKLVDKLGEDTVSRYAPTLNHNYD
jgi:putative FmdB family regulatory protein